MQIARRSCPCHASALFGLAALLSLMMSLTAPSAMAQSDVDTASLWADYNHYVRIARPDLAASAGRALLSGVDEQELLDIVEADTFYRDYAGNTFTLARKIESLRSVTDDLASAIQNARITRSREPDRINADIQRLGGSQRERVNATDRLSAAGQFAAPFLLQTLEDEGASRLHPFVLATMTTIGRPMVYPLSVALQTSEPLQQGQIARVLAQIGYPLALPYIKEVIEDPTTDAQSKRTLQIAYDHLIRTSQTAPDLAAADLYLALSQNFYGSIDDIAGLPGYDRETETGVVWEYRQTVGLASVRVPGAIYNDVLAMQTARQALQLNVDLDAALSQWLAANLRREHNLPAGETDPSYPAQWLEPNYYLLMAGPSRQLDVLQLALDDSEPRLALDAIRALDHTAGTAVLLSSDAASQPLMQALTYYDRRVRFEAAFALTNARPDDAYDGSAAVVPVLAEAIRQSEQRYALVVGPKASEKAAVLEQLAYSVYTGDTLIDASRKLEGEPGVDLIVTAGLTAEQVEQLHFERINDYRLRGLPILAMLTATSSAAERFSAISSSIRPAVDTNDAAALEPALAAAVKSYLGEPLDQELADAYADVALNLLLDVAHGIKAYPVADAEPALLRALGDPRDNVLTKAAAILATIDSQPAQQAIAEAAFTAGSRGQEVQLSLLASLAQSAQNYGNRLSPHQLDQVMNQVRESSGETALGWGRVHGALDLPSANVKQMLVTGNE